MNRYSLITITLLMVIPYLSYSSPDIGKALEGCDGCIKCGTVAAENPEACGKLIDCTAQGFAVLYIIAHNPYYHELDRGTYISMELLLTYSSNFSDYYSRNGFFGAGLEFSLHIARYFSFNYSAIYNQGLESSVNDTNIKNNDFIISQYLGFQIDFVGLYLNYNYYKSYRPNLIYYENSYFGASLALNFPLFRKTGFNIVPFSRLTYNIPDYRLKNEKDETFHSFTIEFGFKIKLGI